MAAPPVFKLPPPQNKQAQSQQAVYRAYINQHPSMRQYANAIYKAATDYGIDPVYYASLLWKESFAAAQASGQDPATIKSPAGATGIAQIMPLHEGEPVPWAPGRKVTQADLNNPAFSIQWGAWYFSQGVQKYGSYDAAYRQYYNPGYSGAVFNDIPKGYVPTTTAKSPAEAAAQSVQTTAAKNALTAVWAVYDGHNVKFVSSPTPPKGTLKIFDQPLTKSDFLQQLSGIQDDYLAYTGKRPTFGQAAQVIKNGWSQYQLRQQLVNSPTFVGSPIWKQNAPGYQSVYQNIFGADAKPDNNAIKYAIANNLGGEGFANYLRQQPNYVKSNEFQQSSNSLTNVFRSIFGEPNQADMGTIEQAALHGYDANTFAQYLRSQPSYRGSPEFMTKVTNMMDALGIVMGTSTTLVPGNMNQPGATGPTIPTDTREPGAVAPRGLGLMPGPSQAWQPPSGQPFTGQPGEPALT